MARLRLSRIAFGAALFFATGAAMADPFTLTAFALSAAGYTTAAFVVTLAGALITSNQAKRKQAAAAAAQRSAYNASLQDRNVTGLSAEAPWQIVYGNPAPVGGSLVALLSSGDRDQFKHLVIAFAAHECQAIDELYIDGEPMGTLDGGGSCTTGAFFEVRPDLVFTETIAFDAAGNGNAARFVSRVIAGVVVTPVTIYDTQTTIEIAYNVVPTGGTGLTISAQPLRPAFITVTYVYPAGVSRVNVQKHLSPGGVDTADAFLQSRTASWVASDRLSGYTYGVFMLDQDLARFQGGPPNISARLRGKKVYDFRTGTTVYSSNPALCLADFIMSEAGYGATLAQFDTASVIASANACDAQGFSCDGAFRTEQDRESTKQQLEDSFGGTCHQSGGVWRITPGAWTAPVMALTDADLAAPIQITQASYTSKERYNTVRGKYIDGAGLGVATDFTPWQNGAYVATDGLVKLRDITLPFTKDHQRAQDLARMLVERSRGGLTITYPGQMRLWPLQPGDRVSITNAEFGWSGKTFRVTDWAFHPRTPVALTMVEDVAVYYNAAAVITADAAPNTNLPSPYAVPDLSGLTAASGTNYLVLQADGTIVTRVLVSWLASTSNYVRNGGSVQVQWRRATATDDVWATENQPGDGSSTFLAGLPDGANVLIRARFINELNIPGNWTTIAHTVIGKTEPPPDVQAFTITGQTLAWSAVGVIDLAGYRVRFNYGQNSAWGTATALHVGLITESPWTPEILPPGQITLLVKAVDTTGNESLTPATIYTNLGDVIVENLILSYDDKAAGFPGTKTNASVVGGNLLADDSGDLFWRDDGANFYAADTALFWPTATYLQLAYTTAYQVQPSEAGSRLTLQTAVVGESYTIEYRYDTEGAFWGIDADFHWGADADYYWTQPTAWRTWPGEIENVPSVRIEFRITAQASVVRGAVNALTLQFDVEDEFEELNDIVISAAGTRLPVTKAYRAIANVQLTLQSTGSGAISARWVDKLSTGPLVVCVNNAGTQVAGNVDARIQGVKG